MRKLFWILLGIALTGVSLQAENWPGFRGPTGQGESSETGLALHWSATSNVLWKTPIPGEGWSSPIVWGDRVFVTTTTENNFSLRMLCLDRQSGKILWDKEVFRQKPRRKESQNSFATPTPLTDGERVYAVFGSGGIAALTMDGTMAWTNTTVDFYSRHGLGASPVLHGNLLIMPFDGSTPVDQAGQWPKVTDVERTGWQLPWDKSFLLAVDKSTGKEIWRARRGLSRIAHVTPKVWTAPDGHTELISGAGDVVQGFDLRDGARLWTARSRGEGVVPSLVIGDGLVFASSGFETPTIRAVRPGGKDDVTQTHIVWEQKKGVPTLASFIYARPHLFAATDGGIASCYQAATGEVVWQERLGGRHSPSPVLAEGRIYFMNESGETTVVVAGPEFKVLAKSSIGEKCQASMAVSQKRLFLRTEKNLFCIGQQ